MLYSWLVLAYSFFVMIYECVLRGSWLVCERFSVYAFVGL